MKALRLKIHQSSANYRKEETLDNKMTYPLPPLSTVIGALHEACGYREYHPMDLSIQGRYESLHREPYTDYCFLNSTMDDRGILVKMASASMLSTAYEKVASAKKSQGNSFRNDITVQVFNQKLMDEYRELKDLNDKIQDFKKVRLTPVYQLLSTRKKHLADKKKKLDKGSPEYAKAADREKEMKSLEKRIKEETENYQLVNYTKPIARYRSLTTSLKYYEILDNVELIIHIKADEEELNHILEHIYNLKSIGRSEDTVQVLEARLVELTEGEDCSSQYSAYIGYEELRDEKIFADKGSAGRSIHGTRYYLNKRYHIVDGKRVFEKKKVMYISEYGIDETGDNVYLDQEDGSRYIVTFL